MAEWAPGAIDCLLRGQPAWSLSIANLYALDPGGTQPHSRQVVFVGGSGCVGPMPLAGPARHEQVI